MKSEPFIVVLLTLFVWWQPISIQPVALSQESGMVQAGIVQLGIQNSGAKKSKGDKPAGASPNASQDENTFQRQVTEKQTIILQGKRPVLAYNHQTILPPQGIDKVYARSGHIHPLYTPAGKIVTDDFSDDHAHQHGLFNAFVKARLNGEVLDFWNQHRRTGDVKSAGLPAKIGKSNTLQTQQIHFRAKDKTPVFDEKWQVVVAERSGMFVIDLKIEITNVAQSQVVIEKNHYGSFGLRGASAWRDSESSQFEFLTESGKNRTNGNLSREKWVAMQGIIDGDWCGVAVLGHPGNFRAPQPARLHPTMPYFSLAPMALGSFELAAGETQSSRFRLVTFDGKLSREKIKALAF